MKQQQLIVVGGNIVLGSKSAVPALIRVTRSSPLPVPPPHFDGVAYYTFLLGGIQFAAEEGCDTNWFEARHFRLQLEDAADWRLAPPHWDHDRDRKSALERFDRWPRMRIPRGRIIDLARFYGHGFCGHICMELQYRGQMREFLSPCLERQHYDG